MAGSTGLEPAASAVTGQRSNQLNYDPAFGYIGLAETRVAAGDWLAVQTGCVKAFRTRQNDCNRRTGGSVEPLAEVIPAAARSQN